MDNKIASDAFGFLVFEHVELFSVQFENGTRPENKETKTDSSRNFDIYCHNTRIKRAFVSAFL